jgi:ABC-type multidrug transport system permease subunit
MRFVLTAALKDIRRRLTDPAALAMWMGLPVVIGGLMSLLSSGNGPAIKAHLLVVDEDQSLLSGLVLSGGRQGQLGEMLDIELVKADEGRKKIDAGGASALLTIPKGFQDGVLRDRPVNLALVTNPSQRILPGIIEEGLKMLVEAAFYVQRLFGPAVQNVADTIGGGAGPSDDRVAAISRAFSQRLRMLQDTLVPPLLSLEAKTTSDSEVTGDFWSLFLPGLLFMSLLFTAQGMSLDIWTEKMSGTLRRTLSTPQGAGAFLAGKLVAGLAIMSVAVLGTLVLGVTMFHIPLVRAPIAFLWATFAGGALFCYFVFIQLHATSMRGGQFLSTMVVFPLMMMGGSFFPFEVMPAWMANIGRWTPNGLAVANVKQILFGRLDPGSLAIAGLAMGTLAVLAFVMGVRRLRGTFAVS